MKHKLPAAVVAIWLTVASAVADVPSATALADARGLLQRRDQGLVTDGPHCFSIGRSLAASESESAWLAAEKVAGVKALANYLSATLLVDDVPVGVPLSIVEDLSQRCSAMIVTRLQLSGVEAVAELRHPDRSVTVIKAVPIEHVRRETRHWQGCVDLVSESALGGHAEDSALWAEVLAATGKPIDAAVKAWEAVVRKLPAVAATIDGSAYELTDGWLRLPETLDPDRVAAMRVPKLLELLDRRPFDGQLIDAIAQRLQEASRPSVACVTKSWRRVQAIPVADEVLAATVRVGGIEAQSAPIGLIVLLRHASTWPFFKDQSAPETAAKAFRKGDIRTAAAELLDQFQRKPNVEAASLMAACLLHAEEFSAAEFWARMGYDRQPRHMHAGINLARALEGLGRLDECRTVARRVEELADLDEWGRGEVNRILRPAASPSEKGDTADPVVVPDAAASDSEQP